MKKAISAITGCLLYQGCTVDLCYSLVSQQSVLLIGCVMDNNNMAAGLSYNLPSSQGTWRRSKSNVTNGQL